MTCYPPPKTIDDYDPKVGEVRNPVPQPEFDEELRNKHIVYTYDNGWTYEFHIPNEYRYVYKIHGGPMAGRINYQNTYYQRIRKNVWQVNWLEETGTVVSFVLDLEEKRITTLMAFSQGHWENPEAAHGFKNEKLADWRQLSKIGIQTNRYMLTEQATINTITEGPGDLPLVDLSWPTL
uniref:ARAD1D43120p n=1 Tax=Blastobotrys adeninivorans TaxID=409370 RepID=A0A060TDE6_BLAAD